MSMEGFGFTQSVQGKVSSKMTARTADLYENKETRLQELKIEFNSPDNKKATLLGETGTMDTATGNGSIHSGARSVRVMTSDGYLLTTNSLVWNAGKRIVRTADPFKLLGREIYLEGRGFSADVNMGTMKVDSNVKAVLQE